jgi:hypothetical protein
MAKIYLPFFLLLTSYTNGFAQVRITIKSATDKVALPYATIVNLKSGAMYSADKNGESLVATGIADSFHITYIGYKNLYIVLKATDKDKTIYLEPAIATLKAIVLPPCKLTKITKIKTNNKRNGSTLGGFGCFSKNKMPNYNGKFAVHLSADKSWAKLQTLSFWLVDSRAWPNTPDFAFESPLSLSFYSIDEVTKTPSYLLNDKPIIIFPEKEGKQILDLDSLDISLPTEGVFVSFEFILDTAYQWKTYYKDTVTIHQGVNIAGAYTEGYGVVYFNYKTNNWTHARGFDPINPMKNKGSLKLETTYKICKD